MLYLSSSKDKHVPDCFLHVLRSIVNVPVGKNFLFV